MTVDVATAIVTPLFTTKGPAASMVPVSATGERPALPPGFAAGQDPFPLLLCTLCAKLPCLLAPAATTAEVLLARDSSGVLYGPEGRPSKRGGGSGAVDWAVSPAVLAVSEPYAVAVSEAGVEARLLQPLNAAGGAGAAVGLPWAQLFLSHWQLPVSAAGGWVVQLPRSIVPLPLNLRPASTPGPQTCGSSWRWRCRPPPPHAGWLPPPPRMARSSLPAGARALSSR